MDYNLWLIIICDWLYNFWLIHKSYEWVTQHLSGYQRQWLSSQSFSTSPPTIHLSRMLFCMYSALHWLFWLLVLILLFRYSLHELKNFLVRTSLLKLAEKKGCLDGRLRLLLGAFWVILNDLSEFYSYYFLLLYLITYIQFIKWYFNCIDF